MRILPSRRAAIGASAATLALALSARGGATAQPALAGGFERDRQSVLAMSGTFHVRFETRETVPFVADYEPLEPSISAGNEVVRVVEDTGSTIRLQHILVVSHGGADIVVRHWRQDWVYEPRHVLAYMGDDRWRLQPIASAERRGKWAQIVYNTDDSPRYGALGAWEHDYGVSRWTSVRGLRPVARRDAVADRPYSHYSCVNRHAITPNGWVHEQDNAKIGARNGALVTFVHETVLNSYNRGDDFPISAADDYLAATQPYWDAVRGLWDERIAEFSGLWLQEADQTGAASGPPLMQLAEQVQSGDLALDAAIRRAREIVADTTRQP